MQPGQKDMLCQATDQLGKQTLDNSKYPLTQYISIKMMILPLEVILQQTNTARLRESGVILSNRAS